MNRVEALQSGKGHKDENFPVASFLIRARHRPVILAFYRFVRASDDIADNPSTSAAEKLQLLDTMRRALVGEAVGVPQAAALRSALTESRLATCHAEDLLEAFRRDVTKLRYDRWDDLMDYCRYSAMPVGRFVLDVHQESRSLWPLSDALCAALQVINHLQDCGADYRALDRVYIPLVDFRQAGIGPEVLGRTTASPALRALIGRLAERTAGLLSEARPFAGRIRDARLGLEVSIIQRLAEDLVQRLGRCDPLSERVHHVGVEWAGLALLAAGRFAAARFAAAGRVG